MQCREEEGLKEKCAPFRPKRPWREDDGTLRWWERIQLAEHISSLGFESLMGWGGAEDTLRVRWEQKHFFLFFFLSLTLLQMSTFPPLCLPPPIPCPPFSLAITTLLSVSIGYSYMFFGWSLHLLSSRTPSPLPSDSCQSVPHTHTSGSILFVGYFVD